MLRVGAVNYLNSKPLIRHLPRLAPSLDLVLDVPSQLALDLAEGRLDIALIRSIEYFRAGNYTILPEVSISSFGHVLSVKVCSKIPFEQVTTVACDEGSRTSVALAEILLDHLYGVQMHATTLPLHKDPLECTSEAVLVIGDRAMRIADGTFPYTLDLGYEWSLWTGLPFVFAFWAVAEGVTVPPDIQAMFVKAKECGQREAGAIASAEARALGLDETRCRYYLEHVIHHDFGRDELAGLNQFYQRAARRELAPTGVACVFHGDEHLAKNR